MLLNNSEHKKINPASPQLLAGLEKCRHRIENACGKEAGERFILLMLNTWETTLHRQGDRVFVITGDIPAMWLRDSSAQITPFMHMLHIPEVINAVQGIIRQQWHCIAIDPYANAFNNGATGAHYAPDDLQLKAEVWERKYEIDSLAFPVLLAYKLWRRTGNYSHLNSQVHAGCQEIVNLWKLEQNHAYSPYRHVRSSDPVDTLPRQGRGSIVAATGMTWSGFRPSDDASTYGYNIPAQFMAILALKHIKEMAQQIWKDAKLAAQANQLATEITTGIKRFGHTEVRLYYEVDGLGNALEMDDANMPSLLSLPLLSEIDISNPVYQATRKWILSRQNPYFYEGIYASGIGSPHTPSGYIWHIALAVQGLTGSKQEGHRCLETILATDGNTKMTHESFDPNHPRTFTRPWFSWSNSMTCELMLHLSA